MLWTWILGGERLFRVGNCIRGSRDDYFAAIRSSDGVWACAAGFLVAQKWFWGDAVDVFTADVVAKVAVFLLLRVCWCWCCVVLFFPFPPGFSGAVAVAVAAAGFSCFLLLLLLPVFFGFCKWSEAGLVYSVLHWKLVVLLHGVKKLIPEVLYYQGALMLLGAIEICGYFFFSCILYVLVLFLVGF